MLSKLYEPFWQRMEQTKARRLLPELRQQTERRLADPKQGDLPRWLLVLDCLPEINNCQVDLSDRVQVNADISSDLRAQIKEQMRELIPWRKGPFEVFETHIDAEWQSNLKWQRLEPHLPSLKHKLILDIGCGNGYYMQRMAAHKPEIICGVDPGLLQTVQFWSIEKYTQSQAAVLPIGVQHLPATGGCFDVVFSMGVLYHRKSPLEHLEHIKALLDKGGQLFLETLVIEGTENCCLIPEDRYAQMRNVWFLPSIPMLMLWLKRMGFVDIECVDCGLTNVNEQRSTEWMLFHSLSDFLTQDNSQTIEGHPPPLRAIIKATKR